MARLRAVLFFVSVLSTPATALAESAAVNCDDSNFQLFAVGAGPGIASAVVNGIYVGKGHAPPSAVTNLGYFSAILNATVAISPLLTYASCSRAPRARNFLIAHAALIVTDIAIAYWASHLPRVIKETAIYPLTRIDHDGYTLGVASGFLF